MMEKRARKRLHVSNILYEMTKDDLTELFSTVGPVLDCELIQNKVTGNFKGSAKIEYPDSYTAKAALRNLNGYKIKGRKLNLNYANSDKFPSEKTEIINEDEFSDLEEFETKNAEKDWTEILTNLPYNQKLFVLEEFRRLSETNEEEFRNILRKDEKLVQALLTMQKELKVDRQNQNMMEEEPVRSHGYSMEDRNRGMNKMGGSHHQMTTNVNSFNSRRMQPMNKTGTQQRRMMSGGRDGMVKTGYGHGGMQPTRMSQGYMGYDDQTMGGMQQMRGTEGQGFIQGNDPRQFNPNMTQQGGNKGKMFYGNNNRMFQG